MKKILFLATVCFTIFSVNFGLFAAGSYPFDPIEEVGCHPPAGLIAHPPSGLIAPSINTAFHPPVGGVMIQPPVGA